MRADACKVKFMIIEGLLIYVETLQDLIVCGHRTNTGNGDGDSRSCSFVLLFGKR